MGPNGHAHTPEPHADKKPLLEFSHKGHSLSTYAELTHPVVLDLNVFGALDVRLCPMDQFSVRSVSSEQSQCRPPPIRSLPCT